MSSDSTSNFHPDGTLFIVSGPSGAGKTTLINRVKKEVEPLGIQLHFSVSHTTREPRAGEQHGKDYYFVAREKFDEMVGRGEFIEWAQVHGYMYGTSKQEVQTRLQRSEDVILDIDVQGAQQISESSDLQPHSLSVFVFPPSFEELEKRLRSRGLNSETEIEIRLRKATSEIEEGCTFYEYVIINDDIDLATACLKAAVIARKLKSKSALLTLREMAHRFKEERNGRATGRS